MTSRAATILIESELKIMNATQYLTTEPFQPESLLRNFYDA